MSEPFNASVLSLYPEMFPGPLGTSLSGQALENGLWQLETVDIRDFASDKHRTVDDSPLGGGAGMVMRPDVVGAAIRKVQENQSVERPLIYLSPRGKPLVQQRAKELAQGPGIILLCGRFEGVDERVLERHQMEEISIGDFVLSGGELAAMVLLDATIRLLPGVMGSEISLEEESFEKGLLEYPHYTRPREWEGMAVPEVLLSGHHEKIRSWRRQRAEETTRKRRPDLWSVYAKTEKNEVEES
ncbi:MAG: tRNA (guanosine(37)-N1)-methyltransferase TrmD [Rhodospirillaceae bacterium]|nr:tRNA (guanosine(37)-N1)-methyltransferase TrmD [Rhodospirillaceae bacterium]